MFAQLLMYIVIVSFNMCNNRENQRTYNTHDPKLHAKPLIDGRAHNPNSNTIHPTKIIDHIMSFNPAVSHYRREHAPNKKY